MIVLKGFKKIIRSIGSQKSMIRLASLFAPVVIVISLVLPSTANAQSWLTPLGVGEALVGILNSIDNISSTAIAWVLAAAGYFIGGVFGFIAHYEANLIAWAIHPGTWGGYATSPFVERGWGIVRDFANMGLVLALVIIAIATILRLESYGMRRTLGRLILAAILINFSLVIAGALIDASNLVTLFFIGRSTATGVSYANMFAENLGITGLLLTREQATAADTAALSRDVGSSLVLLIISIFFFVTFGLVTVVVLGAIFMMVLTRVIVLWILLILSPLSWTFYVFPGLNFGPLSWGNWWRHFLKWTFFTPVVTFFIYLAFTTMATIRVAPLPLGDVPIRTLTQSTTPGWMLNFILFIGLLIGGLWAANEMSITGAKTALNLAGAAARWPGATTGRFVRRKGLQWGTRTDARTGEVTTTLDRFARRLSGIPILGQQMARGITAVQVREAQTMKKEVDRVKDFDSKLLAREAQLPGLAGLRARHALAQRGDLEDLADAFGGGTAGRARAIQLIQGAIPNAASSGLKDALKGYAKYAPTAEILRAAGMTPESVARSYTKDDISEKFSNESWQAIFNTPGMRQAIAENWSGSKLQATYERGGPLYDTLRQYHQDMIHNFENAGIGWEQGYRDMHNYAGGRYLYKNADIWGLAFRPTPGSPAAAAPAAAPAAPAGGAAPAPAAPPPAARPAPGGGAVSPGGVIIPPGVAFTPTPTPPPPPTTSPTTPPTPPPTPPPRSAGTTTPGGVVIPPGVSYTTPPQASQPLPRNQWPSRPAGVPPSWEYYGNNLWAPPQA